MTHTCAVSLAPAKTCRRVAALVQRLTDDEIVCSACVYTRYCRWWGREMEEPSIVFVVFLLKKTHIHILVLCWCTTTLQSIRTLAAWRCIFSRKSKSHAHAQNTHASMPPDALTLSEVFAYESEYWASSMTHSFPLPAGLGKRRNERRAASALSKQTNKCVSLCACV